MRHMYWTSDTGIKTYYEVLGKGKPLILLHGWANTGSDWSYLLSSLSAHFMLIVPDLPGFGRTDIPNAEYWQTQDYANWLMSFVKHCINSKSYYLAGHSFGGQISLEYVQSDRMPKPEKLILIGSAGLKREKTIKGRILGELTKLLPNDLKQKMPKSIKKIVYEKILTETDYFNGNQFQKNVLKHILTQDYTNTLSKIKVKTLIVHGKHDSAVPVKDAYTLNQGIVGSTLVICEDSGHFPHISETPKVSSIIVRFLTS